MADVSVEPTSTRSGHFHAVRFYKDGGELSEIVASFIAEGFVSLQPAVVIATADHRAAVIAALVSRGIAVTRLEAEGALILLDAHALLAHFMVDGMPDAAQFRAAILPIIQRACDSRPERAIRAYGEMVDVLWKKGHTVAATRLEMLWNDLARTHEFSLLCGYSMGSFYKTGDVEAICEQHTHLVSETGESATVHSTASPPS